MRPARRFEREQSEPEVVTAIERLRDALEPGQLRELLDRAARRARRRRPERGLIRLASRVRRGVGSVNR